jgi:tetratricopeptide (TPR) repeat protein
VVLDPRSALLEAGRALQAGQLDRAEAILQQVLKSDRNHVPALVALGMVASASGQERLAQERMLEALRLDPNCIPALNWVSKLCLEAGQVDEAIENCRRILANAPNHPGAHLIIARALTESLRFDEAEAHWKQAETLLPGSAVVHVEKARALTFAGQFEAASAEFLRAIELDETATTPYQALVASKKITRQDLPLIEKMERLVQRSSLSDQARSDLFFALGKSYDNLGDYERAISMFDEANRLQLKHMRPFSLEESKAFVDLQISVFTPEFFARFRNDGLDSDLPLFVNGMLRSGTTLVEQVLTNHRLVGGSGEQGFWSEHAQSVIDWRGRTVNSALLRKVGEEYLRLLAKLAPGFHHVVDKHPSNAMILGTLHLAFPNAKILHLRRNAIDNALSIWMTQMGNRADFVCSRENVVFEFKQYLRLMDHWRKVLPEQQMLEVKYESLVEDPVGITRGMTDFLGIEWEEGCARPETNPQVVRTPSFWQVRQPINSGSVERWKRYEPWLGVFRELEGL